MSKFGFWVWLPNCLRVRASNKPGEPEVLFRIVHHADEHREDSGQIEQPVDIAFGPKGAFERGKSGRLSRLISANRIIDARHPARRRKKTQRKKPNSTPKQPRIVELLLTAEEWKRQIDAGEYENQAELAERKGITRARVTQVLALLRLAPDIRERISANPWTTKGNALTERLLRPLCACQDLTDQRQSFAELVERHDAA